MKAIMALSHQVYGSLKDAIEMDSGAPDGWHEVDNPTRNSPHILSYQTFIRTEAAIDEFFGHIYVPDTRLLMSGGRAQAYNPIPTAKAMRDYAISEGVPDHKVDSEDVSLDTVGYFVFAYLNHLLPLGVDSVDIFSCAHHERRVMEIAQKVMPDLELAFMGVKSHLNEVPEYLTHEQRSLDVFNSQFGAILSGDIEGILNKMFLEHAQYKDKDPSAFLISREARRYLLLL